MSDEVKWMLKNILGAFAAVATLIFFFYLAYYHQSGLQSGLLVIMGLLALVVSLMAFAYYKKKRVGGNATSTASRFEGIRSFFNSKRFRRVQVFGDGLLTLILIVLIILGVLLIIGKALEWIDKRKAKAASKEVWYLSYSEPPEQRKGVKALDEGFAECTDFVDTSSQLSMTCRNRHFRTIEDFRWNKTESLRGTWKRRGDPKTGGDFYLEPDENGVYRGEAHASDGKTRFPILLYKCSKCSK